MKRSHSTQTGQSIVLFAFALLGLVAFLALVVDGANIYVQRRQVQNAVDSASYAGADVLARPQDGRRAYSGEIDDAIKEYAGRNGIVLTDPQTGKVMLHAFYVTRDSSGGTVVDDREISSYLRTIAAPTTINGRPVIGVTVTADKKFNSFFAGVVGWKNFTVNAGRPNNIAGAPPSPTRPPGVPPPENLDCITSDGTTYGSPPSNIPPGQATPASTSNGVCADDGLFPVAFANSSFSDENGDGIRDIHFQESDPTYNYMIWEKKLTAPGNFSYLRWNNQTPDAATLAANMDDTSRSDKWFVGDWIPVATGDMTSSDVRGEWIAHIDKPIVLPVYDQVQGTGSNSTYHIIGFARFLVKGVCRFNNYTGDCTMRDLDNNSQPYIQGKFQQWVDSRYEGGCLNYGISPTQARCPINPQRALSGVVKINRLYPGTVISSTEQHVPVDVVHVLDVSGSMDNSFGYRSKLDVAKESLISFNKNMTVTDRVGVATFPRVTSGSSYRYSCTQSGSWGSYLWGQNRLNMTVLDTLTHRQTVTNTINSLSADSGTPLAGGLLIGRQMVLDPGYHDSSHPAVLIVASDGIANVRLDGKWTGFQGNTYSDVDCNRPAVQDAIDQANLAKTDSNHDGKPDIIIFSIAIGSDFNSVALQAIATEPSSSHFFTASASNMKNIYDQIANVMKNIYGDCQVKENEEYGPYASVVIRNTSTGATYSTTTTATGYYVFTNLEDGTYVFQSVAVTVGNYTYNVFTDGVGGPVLASNPTVSVGQANGNYEKNIFLKTNDTVSCTQQ